MFIALALTAVLVAAIVVANAALRRDPLFEVSAAPVRQSAEWTAIGIRFFSGIAGLALLLAAAFFIRSSSSGWLPVLGLLLGAALLVAGELPIARPVRLVANALTGAGIGILYATLYALHARWNVPLAVTLLGMAAVTAAGVALAIRRGSFFIALLGLLAGFATPALLSFGEDPLALFAYLLLLNLGISWIAHRNSWPLLSALSVTLTVIYEWAWVLRYLTKSQLPLAATIFAVLATVGAFPLWYRHPRRHDAYFQRVGAGAALLPLLFAFYMASIPNYGAEVNVLFGFLFVIAAGLAIIAWRGGPHWLHVAGGIATLVTFLIWFRESYPPEAWPWPLLWVALFVALYLVPLTIFAPLLFFVFVGLAIHEPQHAAPLTVVMLAVLAVLVFACIRSRPVFAAIAIALSSLALMALNPLPLLWPQFPGHALHPTPSVWLLLAAHALVLTALLLVARASGRYVLAVLAVAVYAAMVTTTFSAGAGPLTQFLVALIPYALFLAWPLLLGERRRESLLPDVAAVLASVVFLLSAWAAIENTYYSAFIGVVALAISLALLGTWWLARNVEPRLHRFTLLVSASLAFFNAALPMLLPKEWVVMLWAVEAAALVWLFRRLPYRVLLVVAAMLAAAVFFWLAFDGDLCDSRSAFVVSGLAMIAAAFLALRAMTGLRLYFSLIGLTELLFRINIEIANYYHSTGGALNFSFISPRADVTYTVVWAAVATSLLIIGLLFDWQGARAGAIGLLLATVAKCFLHDLPRLDDRYRTASLFALALALVVVGVALQKSSQRSETFRPLRALWRKETP